MRTHLDTLLIFFLSGWLSGLTALVVINGTKLTTSIFSGVFFSLGVVVAVAISGALKSVTWRFPMRRAMLALALFTVSYPLGLVGMMLAIKLHDSWFPSAAGTQGGIDAGLLTGSAVNALIIATGLRSLTGHSERSVPAHMTFTPPAAALLSMMLPAHTRELFGFSVFFVTTNSLLTFLCGVWLVRGASMNAGAA